MARSEAGKSGLERTVRGIVTAELEKLLGRGAKLPTLVEEIKELRGALDRLERRFESGGRKAAPAARRGRKSKGSPGRPPLHQGCKKPGCTNEHYALGLCSKHYQQDRRGGEELPKRKVAKKGAPKKGARKVGRPRKG